MNGNGESRGNTAERFAGLSKTNQRRLKHGLFT